MKKIIVLGLGSGGMNVLNRGIFTSQLPENVELISVNTDEQILENAKTTKKILIGTNGLGAGGNPDRGKNAVEESEEKIKEAIKDADLLFIIACFGGGTGTGASVKIAEIAKEFNIKTYALISYPFSFEGKKRNNQAINGYRELLAYADEIFVHHNDDLLKTLDRSASLAEAFQITDRLLSEKFFEIYRDEMRKEEKND